MHKFPYTKAAPKSVIGLLTEFIVVDFRTRTHKSLNFAVRIRVCAAPADMAVDKTSIAVKPANIVRFI